MVPKEFKHPAQLIVVLGRVGEEAVVAASFVVMRLDWFLIPSQRRFEFTHQRYLRVYALFVSGTMQDENRHIELRGAVHRPKRMARRIKNSGLHGAYRQ